MSHMLLCMYMRWSLSSISAKLIRSDSCLPPHASGFPRFIDAWIDNHEAITGWAFTDANLIISTWGLWVRIEASSVLESGIIYRSPTTSQKIDSRSFHMRTDVSQGGVGAWILWWTDCPQGWVSGVGGGGVGGGMEHRACHLIPQAENFYGK